MWDVGVSLVVRITAQDLPNWSQFVPRLNRVDLVRGAVDPTGPAMDVVGSADPWQDLWFYTNPIWVVPRS